MPGYSSFGSVIAILCLTLQCVVAPVTAGGDHQGTDGVRQAQEVESVRVNRVQAYFNRMQRAPDMRAWGKEDYWATPSELLRTGSGDCEDIAIAKYFSLRELGVPSTRLRLVYARVFDAERQRIEPHIVLWYRPVLGADWLVLDNLEDDIQRLSSRGDLLPSLTFNEDQVARWSAAGGEQVLGGVELLQPWYVLLARQEVLDSVALVISIHTL